MYGSDGFVKWVRFGRFLPTPNSNKGLLKKLKTKQNHKNNLKNCLVTNFLSNNSARCHPCSSFYINNLIIKQLNSNNFNQIHSIPTWHNRIQPQLINRNKLQTSVGLKCN